MVPLIRKLGEDSARELFEALSKLLYEHKDETTRDLAGSGMKIMLESISTENAKVVIRILIPKLVSGARDAAKPDAVKDRAQMSLELLGELLSRFGKDVSDYDKIQEVVLPLISSKDSMNKKKAIVCLGYLSTVSSDKLFDDLLNHLTTAITKTKEVGSIRTLVQAIGTLSRFAGNRMGKYVDKIFEIVQTYMDHKDFFVEEDKYDDELREICLQTLEALITRCPTELKHHIPEIEKLALRFIKHDPNRMDDDEDADMDVDEDEDQDEEDDDDDYEGDFDDEDDLSWKVRKAAARDIAALIRAYPSQLSNFYGAVAKALISRFAEDEDNVRQEALSTFLTLLHQTAAIGDKTQGAGNAANSLSAHTDALAAQCAKLLSDKHTKIPTRVSALQVLRQAMHVLNGGFESNLEKLVPLCPKSLAVKNASSVLKTEALLFLNALLTLHEPANFAKLTTQIWSAIETAIKDGHYKIIAEGLAVCGQFVKVLTANGTSSDQAKTLIPKIFSVTHAKFVPNELDKEVKEAAIGVMALEISRAGPLIEQASVDECLKILVARLNQEVVRAQVIKAIADIAASPLKVSLASVVQQTAETLTALLRQQSRALRTAAVSTLSTLVQGDHLSDHAGLLEKMIGELAGLLKPEEAHLAHLSLKLAASILQAAPSTSGAVATQLLEPALALFQSSVLQGALLESLSAFLVACSRSGSDALSFNAVSARLITIGTQFDTSAANANLRSFFGCLAACLAALVAVQPVDVQQKIIGKFAADASVDTQELSKRLLGLYSLGEIGRRVDVAAVNGGADVKAVLLANLDAASVEDARSAAAHALGGIAVGNMGQFLPQILSEVDKSPKAKYLLLSSVREVIVAQARTAEGVAQLKGFFAPLSELLTAHTKSEEEGIRNIVAECWGKLALSSPAEVFSVFVAKAKDESAHTRATVVAAIKYSIVSDASAHPEIDDLLATNLSVFFDLLKDSEVSVRHAALLTFNYLSSHRPALVRPVLDQYLPVLYSQTTPKPELITVVKLGPFEHKVDNGLVLRQAAYECMYTLLDTCLAQLDLNTFTKTAYEGIKEETSLDNKALKLLLLSKLTQRTPLAILSSLEFLIAPLTEIINAKLTPEQQTERAEELVRAAFRLIVAIQGIDGASGVSKWSDFIDRVVNAGENKLKYEAILKESK